MCNKYHDHMLYCSWDMVRDRCNCYFSFWTIFCPFTPLTAQKIKIMKKWKTAWRYHHFTYVYHKLWSDDVQFLRYGARWTDGQTDGQTDKRTDGSDIERWVSHLKMEHFDMSKVLNNSTVSKFLTKKLIEVNHLSSGQYSVNKNIRFKTSMSRSDLCDYSDA